MGIGLAPKGFPTTTMMPGWVGGTFGMYHIEKEQMKEKREGKKDQKRREKELIDMIGYHGDDGNRFVERRAKPGWPLYL